jgi:AraC-like DNA-binding protein
LQKGTTIVNTWLCSGCWSLSQNIYQLARQLFVNSNYLNSSIEKPYRQTASAHIQEKILLEAKSFLLHTDLQVSEIAFKLGFENTSYFNRFFKKSTNLTPTEYRKEFVKR